MPDALIESDHFPYLPVTVEVRGQTYQVEALIDTGYTGYLVLPDDFSASEAMPDFQTILQVADTRRIRAPVYVCTIAIGTLPPIDAVVTALGDEPIIGLEVIKQFTLVLDHGIRVRLEP